MIFEPTRAAARKRLSEFVPQAGREYATNRNFDRPGHADVSRLSPYLRHRMITEDTVLEEVLANHNPAAAEKFIQEVFWRTYWKGWMEMRPGVWHAYMAGLSAALNRVQTEAGLRREWEAACRGETGIACFDHWANELAESGYLHNHARMWFASIWIFTLRLPWELGADFFLRHLLDGDPASNTLGWRWVGGLQTIGKTYLARPDNISKYTEGRFDPEGLAGFASPLQGMPNPVRSPSPVSDAVPTGRVGLLVTEDDLSPEWVLEQVKPAAVARFDGTSFRSPLAVAEGVQAFVSSAFTDLEHAFGVMTALQDPDAITKWAERENLDAIALSYAPVGGTSDALSQVKFPLVRLIRPYDKRAWPYATAGFFKFKSQIPRLLEEYNKQLSLL